MQQRPCRCWRGICCSASLREKHRLARRSLTMKSNRVIQPRFSTAFLGAKVEIPFMQVHPLDPYAARRNPVAGGVALSATQEGGDRARRKMAFTAEETCHHFAIETLGRPGSFRPQPYLYTCVRCRWIFRINDSRASIIALEGLGRHLPEPENSKRILTFHRGPCPAFPVFEYLAPETQRASRPLGYLSRFVDALRSLTDGRRRSRSRAEQTTAS